MSFVFASVMVCLIHQRYHLLMAFALLTVLETL